MGLDVQKTLFAKSPDVIMRLYRKSYHKTARNASSFFSFPRFFHLFTARPVRCPLISNDFQD